jgi:hypothetical protein
MPKIYIPLHTMKSWWSKSIHQTVFFFNGKTKLGELLTTTPAKEHKTEHESPS